MLNSPAKSYQQSLELIIDVLTQLDNGNSVSITPIQTELTTQEGADMLHMSRPSFIKLLDSEAIHYSRPDNSRKISFIELYNYKNRQEEARLATLAELSVLDQNLIWVINSKICGDFYLLLQKYIVNM
ncbi:helix-turn-helix domain-containing protein [Vibrio casei]|uniref:DNA-binding protein n=1 Tax=Vibrio casei TaxID=673372 RepID=A0A368LGU9_9VIBR|nr:helix-turn-helix domain-containing protein [Vibrio casei]RCS69989.1 DNA-binding protein [Vibrio casei]SJN31324.1 Excisionase domain protein [Vibrio casei]